MVTTTPSYAVHFEKKTAKSPDRFFIVVQVRRDEFTSPAIFHGIGYWTDKKPSINNSVNVDITEVWIPWQKIDHVESLMYRQRS